MLALLRETVGGGKRQKPTHPAQEPQPGRERVVLTAAWVLGRGSEGLETGYSKKEAIPHQGIGAS